MKECDVCGRPIKGKHHLQKYCSTCALAIRDEQKYEYRKTQEFKAKMKSGIRYPGARDYYVRPTNIWKVRKCMYCGLQINHRTPSAKCCHSCARFLQKHRQHINLHMKSLKLKLKRDYEIEKNGMV